MLRCCAVYRDSKSSADGIARMGGDHVIRVIAFAIGHFFPMKRTAIVSRATSKGGIAEG